MAVHGVITISSNDGNGNLVTFNTMYMGSTYDMEIRQDGIVFEGLKSDGTQIPAESWTYEGQGKFLGLSTTSGATAPDDGCSVGSTIKFEGLDDAYYYIVEEELKGEPPTAESVKSKLQSLITASNTKTGKSDANLTDAVKTLLEGFGSGEGIFAEEENEHGTTIVLGADLQEKTIDITANGTVEVTPDEGYALKKVTANVNVGGEEWINDGNTHIWITLPEGRTSPILYIGVNGTVTVDWGDGTTPDVLTGTSVTSSRWTPAHNYASAGDYIITLTADNEIGFIKYGTSNSGLLIASSRNTVTYLYKGVIKKIECGNNVTNFADSAFADCRSLTAVKLPNGLTKIGFNVFAGDYSLTTITIPEGVQSIGNQAIYECHSLTNITLPSSVTSIDTRGIANCENLSSITLQNGLTSIGVYALSVNYSLNSITIPATVTSIGDRAFDSCYGLAKVRFEPTTPPTLGGSSVFYNVPTDCIISVPVGTLEAYTTATNYPSATTYTYVEE